MANRPDKFGIKFWMAVDVETKYLINGFPYVAKDESRNGNVSVPTEVMMKLMMPLFKKGHNVTVTIILHPSIFVCGLQN